MVDNNIDKMVALTSPVLSQFIIYQPLGIEESDSINSTTLTYTTVYLLAAIQTEDISTLQGGCYISTPIDATFL